MAVRMLLLASSSCSPRMALADFDSGWAAFDHDVYETARKAWGALADEGHAPARDVRGRSR